MPNKRIRQKQERQRLMPGKSLEGFEKHVLREKEKWIAEYNIADSVSNRQTASRHITYYKRVHEDIRRFYFDL